MVGAGLAATLASTLFLTAGAQARSSKGHGGPFRANTRCLEGPENLYNSTGKIIAKTPFEGGSVNLLEYKKNCGSQKAVMAFLEITSQGYQGSVTLYKNRDRYGGGEFTCSQNVKGICYIKVTPRADPAEYSRFSAVASIEGPGGFRREVRARGR